MTGEEEFDENADLFEVLVPDTLGGGRFDKVLADLCPDLSRSRLKTLILSGQVKADNTPLLDPSVKIPAGTRLSVCLPPPVDDTPKPENIPLDIVYEDDDLLVINKQAGLVVHPGAGNWDGTLVNAVLYHCGDQLSGIGGVKRPGIVHRLDKDTSGLILVAKNDHAHQGLSDQLSERSLSRIYQAYVWKVPSPIKGKIDQPIDRHPSNRLKMSVRPNGREALTHYKLLKPFGSASSSLECKLETGRTHQIRVHMAHARYPIIGDPLYGLARQEGRALLEKAGTPPDLTDFILNFPRQALHAREISFIHPSAEAEMHFSAPLPEDLSALENQLKTMT